MVTGLGAHRAPPRPSQGCPHLALGSPPTPAGQGPTRRVYPVQGPGWALGAMLLGSWGLSRQLLRLQSSAPLILYSHLFALTLTILVLHGSVRSYFTHTHTHVHTLTAVKWPATSLLVRGLFPTHTCGVPPRSPAWPLVRPVPSASRRVTSSAPARSCGLRALSTPRGAPGVHPCPRCHRRGATRTVLLSLMSRNCPSSVLAVDLPLREQCCPWPEEGAVWGRGATLVQTSARCSRLPPAHAAQPRSLGRLWEWVSGSGLGGRPKSALAWALPPGQGLPRQWPLPSRLAVRDGARPRSALLSPPPQPRAALQPCPPGPQLPAPSKGVGGVGSSELTCRRGKQTPCVLKCR